MFRTTHLTRILGAAALALAAVGLAGGPASARSLPIPYACGFTVAGAQGTGDATATWDSAVPDEGITVPRWTPVTLDPYTGMVVLPDAFVEALRTEGTGELAGSVTQQVYWDLSGTPRTIGLRFPATAVPATGPMTIALTAVDAGTFSHSDAETFLLIADDFSLATDDETVAMSCAPTDYRESTRVVDSVTVAFATTTPPAPTTAPADPSATTSPSSTAAPARPALVQTDQPQSGGTVSPFVALGVVAVLVAGGAAAAWARRSRRH